MKKNPVDMDMEKPRKIVYHETEAREGMMVYLGAEQTWYDKGWVNTPAKFGLEKEEKKPEFSKEAEKIFTDPPEDDASDLSDYLNKEYGLETNYRMGLKKLKKILQGKLDDNSSKDN